MNKKIKLANLVSVAGIPLVLAVSGCQIKNGTADDSSTNTLFVVTNSPGNGTNSNSADNSQNNARDRNGVNQTPIDQGNSSADIQLTQQIRKLVVNGTNNFSVAAQNIKIITQNGQVTLRGPVENDSEKTSIDALAKSAAGENNVTDQLEVKTNP
jgi:osmotically-inducible protein OsmY